MAETLILTMLIFSIALSMESSAAEESNGEVKKGNIHGYLRVPHGEVSDEYGGGFSMYVAAWPLVEEYPGPGFQTGLFGTWMFAKYKDDAARRAIYSDIEGGLGWWRDTRFATTTPKFIMGGVALKFCAWANGPGAGKGRDWKKPKGKYAVVQVSPNILWPPDGLNLKQGTTGELFGYGYLPLPLIDPKSTTGGADVPTGGNCWTLFLNSGNFRGPVAFFAPHFFARPTIDRPELAGRFLDSQPAQPNRHIAMETQHVPAWSAKAKDGTIYARTATILFPRSTNGSSVVLHDVRSYKREALWDSVKAWFDGGAPAGTAIDVKDSDIYTFANEGNPTWKIATPLLAGDPPPIDWDSVGKAVAPDRHTFAFRWDEDLLRDSENDSLLVFPEYYRLVTDGSDGPRWIAVKPDDVPKETGLQEMDTHPRRRPPLSPYVTPDDPDSCWKKPGPAAGPFKAHPGDGSTVTYYWYRFADQPSMLNADLTDEERELLQSRVEKMHRSWKMDASYLPPPRTGSLADIDPELILTPPKGLEVGYVPIATRQGVGRREK